MESLVLSVEAYVRQRLPQYIEELRTLCAIDSYSYHKPGLDAVAAWLVERLQHIGVEATSIEREKWGNDLYGVLKSDGRGNVLLLGHSDTVYPVGTAAARPLRVDGDTSLGPGTC